MIQELRAGCLPSEVEAGRWNKVPRDNRLCKLCNSGEVEDEMHFLSLLLFSIHNDSVIRMFYNPNTFLWVPSCSEKRGLTVLYNIVLCYITCVQACVLSVLVLVFIFPHLFLILGLYRVCRFSTFILDRICRNWNVECPLLAELGECEANPGTLDIVCARACEQCHGGDTPGLYHHRYRDII